MSASQFKNFLQCEEMAMAIINKTYTPDYTDALLLGGYVDAHLTDDPEKFIEEHRSEIFTKKKDKKYEDFIKADKTIERIKQQPLMMKYLDGEHQKIMTGTIAGVPFKIKMDTYKKGEFISDLKYMKSLRSPNLFEPMISYWKYDIQSAIYREIVRQNTGETLPFVFVIATKEKVPHFAVAEINQYNLDTALDVVKKLAPRFQDIKLGKIQPERCNRYNCDYCSETQVLTELIDTDMLGVDVKGDL